MTRLTGNERLTGGDAPADATVLDFWRWAFSNLQDNTLRGVFAEWLVARLLRVERDIRAEWADYDLMTPEGVRVEVKSAAYQQTWHEAGTKASVIRFDRLLGRVLTPDGASYQGERVHRADVYVFCVQTSRPPQKYDALDLSQWAFYVLSRTRLQQYGWRSISLDPLSRIATSCNAAELRSAVAAAAQENAPLATSDTGSQPPANVHVSAGPESRVGQTRQGSDHTEIAQH
jgi:hypothetical protein